MMLKEIFIVILGLIWPVLAIASNPKPIVVIASFLFGPIIVIFLLGGLVSFFGGYSSEKKEHKIQKTNKMIKDCSKTN